MLIRYVSFEFAMNRRNHMFEFIKAGEEKAVVIVPVPVPRWS